MEIQEIGQNSSYYPIEWQPLLDKPQTLFAIGNVSLIQTRKFTVVGSRRTPTAARKIGAEICKDLSSVFTLVTGVADGGDGAAIEGALAGSGRVICLLAGGLSTLPQGGASILDKVIKRGGLLLSPHPYETTVRNFSYEYRNKLLAALGEGTLVLGAAEKSGALITARYAADFEKPVFALPYAPNTFAGAGCNALIKKGAHLTENSFDIFHRFGINCIEKKEEVALSETETRTLETLRTLGEGHISELSARSGIPVFKLRAVLAALEVKGRVVTLGGNRFSAVSI